MLTDPFTGEPSVPFTLYAMECEGDLSTEQGKYNKLRKYISDNSLSIFSLSDIESALIEAEMLGLDITESEMVDLISKERSEY